MKNKIKSILLAYTMTVACLPFSWTSANAAKPDYSLWDKFIKYDLCITDYDSLTDEEKDLCHFIFDTEQSSDKPIRCERARRTLAHDENIGERITLEQLDGAYGIWDRFSSDKLGWHNYIHCVPDIKVLTNYEKHNEYWLDDEGKNRVYFDGELCRYMPAETYDSFLVKRENDYDMEIEKKQVPFGNLSDKMIVYSNNSEETSLNFDEAIEYEGNYYYITPDNEVVFLKCGNSLNSIYEAEQAEPVTKPLILPEEINGYPLTAIEEEAFRYSLYTEIVLPENLKFIDRRAFAGSPYIQKINFPKGLKYIGSSIFSSCSIKTINIDCPNLIISDGAFSVSMITDANVNAKIIGEGAFQNCTYLENLTSGLTDRQGAGVPNLYRMISIIAQHSYGYGKFTNDSGYSRDIPILQPKYNAEKINVSLAYLQTDVTVSNPDTCDDYDISLINPSLSTKVSNKSRSSTEMIYHNISNTNNNYTLRIQRYENANSPMIHMAEIKYGYAWSTDNTIFYPTNYEDGIYYIKNAKSGKYLTYNNNDDDVKVENFAGDMTQLWVFNDDYGTMDYLKSANGIDNNLDLGTLSGTFYKAIKSSNNFRIGLFNNTDGTYSFERFIGTASYRLGVYNNSLNAGVEASWYTKDVNNSSQQWYLESTGYKRGDINMDGEITNTDASLALSFYSGSSTGNSNINNIQKFLADYDRNGIIDALDSSLILAALTS